MKYLSRLFFPILLLALTYQPAAVAQGFFSIGFSSAPDINCEDFENFHVSDWQEFGLGMEQGEGRIAVPLRDKQYAGSTRGFFIGFGGNAAENFGVLFDMPFTFGNDIWGMDLMAGVRYDFLATDMFYVGLHPKFGYHFRSISFGHTHLLSGYTSPVVIPTHNSNSIYTDRTTFVGGDHLKTVVHGIGYQVSLDIRFQLAGAMFIKAEIGYAGSSFGDMKLKVGGTKLRLDNPSVVKDDFTATPANINPEIEMGGLFFNAGFEFRFGD